MRGARPITETQEQKTVVAYIRRFGFADPLTEWTHIRAERAGLWQALEAKKMGVNTKFPDLHFLRLTNRGWIEMKPRGTKARWARVGTKDPHEIAQLEKHDRLRANGDWVEICETLSEVLEALREHGMPLRIEPISTERIKRSFAAAMGREAAE